MDGQWVHRSSYIKMIPLSLPTPCPQHVALCEEGAPILTVAPFKYWKTVVRSSQRPNSFSLSSGQVLLPLCGFSSDSLSQVSSSIPMFFLSHLWSPTHDFIPPLPWSSYWKRVMLSLANALKDVQKQQNCSSGSSTKR